MNASRAAFADPSAAVSRAGLEARWLDLTRRVLPGLAAERGWPIRNDHCFQRVLLDTVFSGVWYDHVAHRPAYRVMPVDKLAHAVVLADQVAAGEGDLPALNAQSLGWRAAARLSPSRAGRG